MTEPSSFTCPVCGATSHNPNDVREGYCGRCHDWTAGPGDVLSTACTDPSCPAPDGTRACDDDEFPDRPCARLSAEKGLPPCEVHVPGRDAPSPWCAACRMSGAAAENDVPRLRAIRCDDIEALIEAEERGETVECEHVCANALRHAGPLDDLIASLAADPTDEVIRQALWENAVERGEPWATRDLPPDETPYNEIAGWSSTPVVPPGSAEEPSS